MRESIRWVSPVAGSRVSRTAEQFAYGAAVVAVLVAAEPSAVSSPVGRQENDKERRRRVPIDRERSLPHAAERTAALVEFRRLHHLTDSPSFDL